jgi:hypothetical protein
MDFIVLVNIKKDQLLGFILILPFLRFDPTELIKPLHIPRTIASKITTAAGQRIDWVST